jgi:hypothetical protein
MNFASIADRFAAAVGRGLIPWYARRFRTFQKQLHELRGIQERLLLDRISEFRDTKFGRDHGFSSIRSISDFRRQVPVAGYDRFAPYIDAVARGELEALIPRSERLLRFTTTTGTTGIPKLNPVTGTWMREYTRATDLWNIKLILDHPQVIGRKILHLTGTWDMGSTSSGAPISMVSALASRSAHPMVRHFFAVPFEVSSIPDPVAKYYTTLRMSILQNIGVIIAIAPGTVLRLAELGNSECESLIRDIHDGTLSPAFEIPAAIRKSLQPFVSRPAPSHARRLEQIVRQHGRLYPRDYWSHPVIGCWLGGTAGYQSRNLPDFYGESPLRDLGLVSSEGRHTIPLHDNDTAGVLAATTNYYEFVPLEELSNSNPQALEGQELQIGKDYSLVMSTSGGYFRFEIGDVVRCRGFLGQAPLLEFLQKIGRCADLEGEKVTEHQVAQAVNDAAAELQIRVGNVTAVPWRPKNAKPRYVLLAELGDFPETQLAERFVVAVDRLMAAANFLYRGARQSRVLAPLQLRLLPDGSWNSYSLAEQSRRGTGDSQYKHPALLTDSNWLFRFSPAAIIEIPGSGQPFAAAS